MPARRNSTGPLRAALKARQLPGQVVGVSGMKLPSVCPACARKLVLPIGPAQAPVLIVSEFPGWEELRTGRPMSGHAGEVLRKELSRVGITFEDCRVTNLWLHAMPAGGRTKEDKLERQQEYDWHYARLLEEITHHDYLLILGSEVSKALLKLPVMDVAGVPFRGVELRRTMLPANIQMAMAAPSPAIVYQRGQTSGEFALALERFSSILKGQRNGQAGK